MQLKAQALQSYSITVSYIQIYGVPPSDLFCLVIGCSRLCHLACSHACRQMPMGLVYDMLDPAMEVAKGRGPTLPVREAPGVWKASTVTF